MGNGLVNMRDQRFVLYELLQVEALFEKEAFQDYSREVADMILDEAEKMAVHVILPTYVPGDREGCVLQDGRVRVPKTYHEAYRKYCEGGWVCPMKSPDVGGQGMPLVLANACSELFGAANFAFIMYPGLTNGAAGLIEHFGTDRQKEKYMLKMYSGQWTGTMCLTEAGAGSDVGALKTTAKRLPDGTYAISGSKMFISSGDHDLTENIVHAVLARIEGDPTGTAGISLFLVPKIRVNEDGSLGEPNDVVTGNVEHKMGIRGSATCTLNFGDEGKCVGELLGKPREGMHIMFFMMNEARLEVGYQGLGHASAAYEHAVQYAKERIQSAPVWEMKNPHAKAVPIIMHPDVRRDLMWMKARVEGIRALNYFLSMAIDFSRVADTPEERGRWHGYAELLTPVCKAYASDAAVLVASKAIDVYGGYGYCQEYPVEQFLRDAKIATIYEGTNGIQALDLVGRKLAHDKGASLRTLFAEIAKTVARAKAHPELEKCAARLEEACSACADLSLSFAAFGKSGAFLVPVLNASPYLDILGDVLVGHFLLLSAALAQEKLNAIYEETGADSIGRRRALVHTSGEVAFYAGKVAVAQFFAGDDLATVKARCEAIKAGERSVLEMAVESFAG